MSEHIRKKIAEVSKLMYNAGYANAYEGNISMLNEKDVYITPTMTSKGLLTTDMIAVTNLDGKVIKGTTKPSSEIKLHLGVYRNRKDVKSVVHAHSPYATAFALANKPIETKGYTEMLMLFEKIPVADYGTPSTDEIYYGVGKYINDYDIILLANHGIVTLGTDAYDAYFKLESAESMAKTLILARQLGGEKELPDHRIRQLNIIRLKKNK